jgi:hypothetical protein
MIIQKKLKVLDLVNFMGCPRGAAHRKCVWFYVSACIFITRGNLLYLPSTKQSTMKELITILALLFAGISIIGVCYAKQDSRKNLAFALMLLFAGLYVVGFGIFTVSYIHMLWTGMALTGLGVASVSLALLVITERHVQKNV